MKTRWLTSRGGRLLAVLLAACLRGTALADDTDPHTRPARLSDFEGLISLAPGQSRITSPVAAGSSRPTETVAQANAFVPPALTGEEASPTVVRPSAPPAAAAHSPGVDAAGRQPADHPPVASSAYHAAGIPVPTPSASQPAQQSPPSTLAPAPPLRSGTPPRAPLPSAPATAAPHETSRETRDGAPHADRASRERAVR